MQQSKLGAQLRALRRKKGFSVRTLAARSGFSPSFISQVESDAVSPSIASLEKIAGQLDITLGQLFSSLEATPRTVVRHHERAIYTSAWSNSTVESLIDGAPDRILSGMLVKIAPKGFSGKRHATSLSDTFAFILEGQLTLSTEEEQIELGVGDSAYLQEGDLYMWENRTDSTATLLFVTAASGYERLLNGSNQLPREHTPIDE